MVGHYTIQPIHGATMVPGAIGQRTLFPVVTAGKSKLKHSTAIAIFHIQQSIRTGETGVIGHLIGRAQAILRQKKAVPFGVTITIPVPTVALICMDGTCIALHGQVVVARAGLSKTRGHRFIAQLPGIVLDYAIGTEQVSITPMSMDN